MASPVLKNPDFVKLWLGQGVSLFGSLINRIVLPFLLIYTFSASPMDVAWLRVAEIAPGMLIGLGIGVAVDRWRRRPVMLAMDTARATLVGLIPILFLLHRLTMGDIMGVAVLMSVTSMGFDSAYDAYLPTLVEADEIVDANSKLAALAAVAEAAGFGIAGALFQWLGGALTLSIDALSFVASAVSLRLIRRAEPRPVRSPIPPSPAAELGAGLRALRGSPVLSRMAAVAGVQSLFFGLTGAVYMLYISRSLQVAPVLQGGLYAVGGLSSLATAGLASRLGQRSGSVRILVLAAAGGALGALFLPLAFGPLPLVLAFILAQQLLGDGSDTLLDISLSSLRQTHTPNALLGRVSAAWFVLTGVGMVGGTLLGGAVAGVIGLRDTLFLGVAVRLGMIALIAAGRPWRRGTGRLADSRVL